MTERSFRPSLARWLLLVWVGWLIAWPGREAACRAEAVKKPNIIVIFTDDQGYADLSCQEIVQDIRTPHLDALAAGGVRMTDGYVTAPQCVPSRAGLLTGRYQQRFGLEHNGAPRDGFDAQLTIAERLRRAGYVTGMTGKWHLGPGPEIPQHGFDFVYYKHSAAPAWANFNLDGTDRPGGPARSDLYHLDANTEAACAFIRRHHKRPFFFYCAYRAPHVPLDPPPKYLKRFPGKMPERRRKALAMIAAVDDGVGRIVQTLRDCGVEGRTLIFFISDNGAPLKIHKLDAPGGGPGWDGSLNDPLCGEKGMLTEGGIRVPFLVYWKGHLPAGQVYRHPVISLDVAATAVALAGLRPDPQLDGVDLIPYLRGERKDPPHKTLYWRWITQSAIREGQWKLLRAGKRRYLFDLQADPEERHNLLSQYPEVAERLAAKLEKWADELQPPGLAAGPMRQVWEQYYDYYLEGKPAPPPKKVRSRGTTAGRVAGWLGRGGTLKLENGSLRVRPSGKTSRLFIVASGLRLPSRLEAAVRWRVPKAGRAGIAWRQKGQADFSPEQVVWFECHESSEWQTHEVKIPATGPVIHVRLLLPPAGADIASIEFRDTTGKRLRKWDFSSPLPHGIPEQGEGDSTRDAQQTPE